MHDAWKCWTCRGSGRVEEGNGAPPRVCSSCRGRGVSLSGTAAVVVMSGLVGWLLFLTDLQGPGLIAQIQRIEAAIDPEKRPESAVLILHWSDYTARSATIQAAPIQAATIQAGQMPAGETQKVVAKDLAKP